MPELPSLAAGDGSIRDCTKSVRGSKAFAALAWAAGIGAASCGDTDCDSAPAGFELVVWAPQPIDRDVQSIAVLLAIDEVRWQQSFDLADTFADGETSFYIAVEPAPEEMFSAALLVEGFSKNGRMTARGTGQFEATPDSCNRFRVPLERPPPRRSSDAD